MNSATNNLPILITGVSGLIGTEVAKRLSSQYPIVGLDIKEPEDQKLAAFIHCDMTDDASVAASLDEVKSRFGGRLASVVHLAAYYDFSGQPSPMYQKLTVEGTRRLLRQLQSFEQVEQLIFTSTLLAMKPSDDQPLTESSPVQGEWDYPQSKLEAENVIQNQREEIPALVLRIAGVYDEDCNSLPLSQHIHRIREKQMESFVFPGNADRGQAYVHLADLIECVWLGVQRRHQLDPYEVLLIGEPDVMTYAQLQDQIGLHVHGSQWPTIRIPKAVAKVGAWVQDKMAKSEEEKPFIKPWMIDLADQHYAVSIQRARERLGWQPQHTLRDTLPEMVRRMKNDPVTWHEKNGLPLPQDLQAAQATSGSIQQ